MIEKRWLLKILDKTKVIKHLYVIFLLLISFIIFNASNMKEAWLDIRCMFGMGGIPVVSGEALYYLKSYGVTFLVSMIGCLPVAKKFAGRWQILKVAGVLLLLILSTAYLVDGSFNPFLYFRF